MDLGRLCLCMVDHDGQHGHLLRRCCHAKLRPLCARDTGGAGRWCLGPGSWLVIKRCAGRQVRDSLSRPGAQLLRKRRCAFLHPHAWGRCYNVAILPVLAGCLGTLRSPRALRGKEAIEYWGKLDANFHAVKLLIFVAYLMMHAVFIQLGFQKVKCAIYWALPGLIIGMGVA